MDKPHGPNESGDRAPCHPSIAPQDEANLFRGRTILIVDDNSDNQNILRHLLRSTGAQLVLANHGQDAIDIVNMPGQKPFDAIIMDMMMPVLDGYQATQALRDQGTTTPIVAVTACAMPYDEKKCLDSGCDAYLSKPIEIDQLIEVLQGQFASADTTHVETTPADMTSADMTSADMTSAETTSTNDPENDETVRSTMAEDPRFEPILRDYLSRLVEVLAELRQARESNDIDCARVLAHRLRGTGASFGFPELSTLAAAVEDPILTQTAPADLPATAVDELLRYLRRITDNTR